MKYLLPLLLVVITAFNLGCSSAPIAYETRFSQEAAFWKNGLGYIEIKDSGITVRYAAKEAKADSMIFMVELLNTGKKSILVSSSLFNVASDDNSKLYLADDPEVILNQLNVQIAAQERDLTPSGLDTGVILLDTVGAVADVADLASRSQNESELAESRTREEERTRRRTDRNEKEAQIRSNLSELKMQRDVISEKYLRKTTLRSGEAVHGLIQFRMRPTVGSWKIACGLLKSQTDATVPKFAVNQRVH